VCECELFRALENGGALENGISGALADFSMDNRTLNKISIEALRLPTSKTAGN
jgi:hypothetical protein